MNKLTVKINKKNVSFGVNNYKYLLGNNYSKKFQLAQSIRKCFERGSNSEYAIDNNGELIFRINDKEVDLRKWKLFNVTTSFDYKTEMKLGSKSIMLNYLEAVFKDIEYDDLVNTLRIVRDDLSYSMSDKLEENNQYRLNIKFEELILKNLIKQIELSLYKEDKISNEYDFNYDDLIIFQLNTIYRIVENIRDFEYICIVEIPVITSKIKEEIEKNKYINLMIIVVSNNTVVDLIDLLNVLSVNKKVIDFSDEVSIYNEIILELERSTTIKELQDYAKEYFTNEQAQDNLKLAQIL